MSTQSLAAPRARRFSPWPFIVLAIGVAIPLLPYFFGVSHFVLSMFMQATTYAIAVLGMVVVLGYTGQINLAQAAFFGFGAYGVALGTVSYGLSFWVSLAIGIGIAGVAGGILGLTTLRLGGHYLAMITISFQQIFDDQGHYFPLNSAENPINSVKMYKDGKMYTLPMQLAD